MTLIDKIRSKSHSEKMRLIWTVVAIVAVLLIVAWALSAKVGKNAPKDTTLFETIGQGFKDVKNNFRK